MLKKLIKYELKSTKKMMGILFAVRLAVAILVNMLFIVAKNNEFFSNLEIREVVEPFLEILFGIGLNLVIASSYYSFLLGKRNYLMLSLPLKPYDIAVSKFLVGFMWALIYVLLSITLNKMFGVPNLLSNTSEIISDQPVSIFKSTALWGAVWLNILVKPMFGVSLVLISITIGFASENNKTLMCVVAFIGAIIVTGILSTDLLLMLSLRVLLDETSTIVDIAIRMNMILNAISICGGYINYRFIRSVLHNKVNVA